MIINGVISLAAIVIFGLKKKNKKVLLVLLIIILGINQQVKMIAGVSLKSSNLKFHGVQI